jgi:hypothetical protein
MLDGVKSTEKLQQTCSVFWKSLQVTKIALILKTRSSDDVTMIEEQLQASVFEVKT